MPFWREVDEALDVTATLSALDDRAAEAAVALLVLTVHADARVLPLEVAGVNHLLFDLPGLEARHERLREWVRRAAARAEAGRSAEMLRSLVDEAAAAIPGPELREKVFAMAVALARVDLRLDPAESQALLWMSEALEIDAARARALIEDGYR